MKSLLQPANCRRCEKRERGMAVRRKEDGIVGIELGISGRESKTSLC